MDGRKGFILIFTLIMTASLTIIAGALAVMMAYGSRMSVNQVKDVKLNGIAGAGEELALRAIRDDYLGSGETGTADLRGEDTSLSTSVGNANRMRYFADGNASINNDNDDAKLRTFDSNYVNTRIISLYLGVAAERAGGASGSATIEVSYTTDGSFPQAGNTVLTQELTRDIETYLVDITADRAWTWDTIMSPNFILMARRISGNRSINLDCLFLRVTYTIDTLKESWATGSYAAFPVDIGDGTIESVSITDEQSRVHLNYAAEDLLAALFSNLGVSSANSKASNVVSYRGPLLTNPFESVEELHQVEDITDSDYDLIKDYVTVYSFINTYTYRPSGPRAPVNINTAPYEVLKAVFDPVNLASGDPARIADDIIAFRDSTPFTCLFSSDPAVTTDFYDFMQDRGYLNNAQENRVLDNCDPSSLVPVSGFSGYDCLSMEFCYASNIFRIETTADLTGRRLRVAVLRGNDGSRAFSSYIGDTAPSGWRQEEYE